MLSMKMMREDLRLWAMSMNSSTESQIVRRANDNTDGMLLLLQPVVSAACTVLPPAATIAMQPE